MPLLVLLASLSCYSFILLQMIFFFSSWCWSWSCKEQSCCVFVSEWTEILLLRLPSVLLDCCVRETGDGECVCCSGVPAAAAPRTSLPRASLHLEELPAREGTEPREREKNEGRRRDEGEGCFLSPIHTTRRFMMEREREREREKNEGLRRDEGEACFRIHTIHTFH